MPPTIRDVRLVPSAAGAFGAAWWLTGSPPPWVVQPAAPGEGRAVVLGIVVAGGLALAGLLLTGALLLGSPRAALRPTGSLVATAALAVGVSLVVLAAGAVQQGTRAASGLGGAEASGTVTVVGVVRTDPHVLGGGTPGDGAPPPEPADARRLTVVLDVRSVERAATGPAPGTTVTIRAAAPVQVVGGPQWAGVVVGEVVRARGTPGDTWSTAAAGFTARGAPELVARAGGVLAATARARAALLDVSDDLPPDARGLVPGIAVGDTHRIPADLDEALVVSGLTHVTAVSGAHFAIVVAVLTVLCHLLRLPRAVRVVVLAASAAGFVALVRPEASVLRSAATCGVGLLAACVARPAQGLPALAGGVVVLLVADPWLARSYGFVLSTLATAGIVVAAGPLARRLTPWLPQPAALAVAVPFAAQLACAPVLVLLSPQVPLHAVTANLAAEPAVAPATVLGLLATLLAPAWPGAAGVLAHGAGWATWWIALVARTAAGLPGATLAWPGGAGGLLLLAAVEAVLVAAVWRWRDLAWLLALPAPWAPGEGGRRRGPGHAVALPSPSALRGRLGAWLQRRRPPGEHRGAPWRRWRTRRSRPPPSCS